MPSFCPKLEPSIKAMHRRKAKNNQKFTKICFSWKLSLKSWRINFHEFWIIFDPSGPHHLKKLQKKPEIISEKTKNVDFFLWWAINHPKIIKKSKFLCSITSHAPKTTEKNFRGHWDNIHEMKSRYRKKNIPEEIQVRLESLPTKNAILPKLQKLSKFKLL